MGGFGGNFGGQKGAKRDQFGPKWGRMGAKLEPTYASEGPKGGKFGVWRAFEEHFKAS